MTASQPRPASEPTAEPTLREILGGRGGAVDASLPVAAFVAAWLLAGAFGSGSAVAWGAAAAVLAGAVVAGVRLATGRRRGRCCSACSEWRSPR